MLEDPGTLRQTRSSLNKLREKKSIFGYPEKGFYGRPTWIGRHVAEFGRSPQIQNLDPRNC